MARTRQRRRRLWDAYCFPGFAAPGARSVVRRHAGLSRIEVRRLDCRTCDKGKREQLDLLADNPLYTKPFAHYVGRGYRGAPIKEGATEMELDWHRVQAPSPQ